MMTGPPRTTAALASLITVAALLLAACGQPTAQIVTPGESHFSFELPVEYSDIGNADQGDGVVFGPPDASAAAIGNDPVLVVGALPTTGSIAMGSVASFASLRQLSTANEFDPMDEELDPLPNNTRLLGYTEIHQAEVWGVRLRMVADQGATDFQALVDRQSGQVVVSRVICTLACFLEQTDLIDDIQGSWSLEP